MTLINFKNVLNELPAEYGVKLVLLFNGVITGAYYNGSRWEPVGVSGGAQLISKVVGWTSINEAGRYSDSPIRYDLEDKIIKREPVLYSQF